MLVFIYTQSSDCFVTFKILDAYGDSLEAERKHEDAGVAFLAAGQLTKAMHSYR